MKLTKTEDFKHKLKLIKEFAAKYKWNLVRTDIDFGRISLTDELSIFNIDIYTTKMTVCFFPKGEKPTFLKRQSIDMIESILKNPFKI